jgi:hypothetical protein
VNKNVLTTILLVSLSGCWLKCDDGDYSCFDQCFDELRDGAYCTILCEKEEKDASAEDAYSLDVEEFDAVSQDAYRPSQCELSCYSRCETDTLCRSRCVEEC